MEMNTRLQVEHPVTEAITGEDLVEWQLRVAAGSRCPRRRAAAHQGHAIEAHLRREPREQLPARHRPLASTASPNASFQIGDVRVDDGVREGDAISPFYDSMIAKLIVHGDDRAQALARLDAAWPRPISWA
jgi:3-methylcrotonyl-CoA carboxylase alpha subunit